MSTKLARTVLAFCLALGATPATSAEAPSAARTASLLGHYIALQGNLALDQIRTEITMELAKALRPLLPDTQTVTPDADAPSRVSGSR